MDPRRWDRICEEFAAIVDLDPSERASRLEALGHHDAELRDAVAALLTADAAGGVLLGPIESHFVAAPAPDGSDVDATPPDVGERLQAALGGVYRIRRELGGGGMSGVYVADETAFRRLVVIKILKPQFTEVISAKRFQREIQVAARLQHPHIVPLLSAGDAGGLLYYTMPFVEGESLRDRLRRQGELAIDEVVLILSDIASALAYAHRHGVVHRDIKPDNVLLSDGGAVVADFGIAKAINHSLCGVSDEVSGTTITTQGGLILGTPLYMAPEQAIGDPATDHRADIYALGALAYEMLAGGPPFAVRSPRNLLVAHATEIPESIVRRRPSTPPWLASLVMQCLEKRPADRPRDAAQLLQALRDKRHSSSPGEATRSAVLDVPVGRDSETGPAEHADRATRKSFRALAASSLALAGVVVTTGLWAFSVRSTTPESLSFQILPPVSNGVRDRIGDIAISRDGKMIAFVGRSDSSAQVYLRALTDLNPRPLPGSNGAAQVAFSPDGRYVSVITLNGRLLKIAIDGSSTVVLADSLSAWGGSSWENEHTILVQGSRGITRIPTAGGLPRALTRADWEQARPVVGDDGKTLLFEDWGPGGAEDDFIAIGSLATGEYTKTRIPAVHPIAAVDRHILYLDAAGNIMAIPFDGARRRVTGARLRILDGVSVSDWPDMPTVALSRTGTLVYKRGSFTQRLVLVDSGGATQYLSDDDRDFAPMRDGGRPAVSPDGRRIATHVLTHRSDTASADIWTLDLASRTFTRITSLGDAGLPEWTPDGRALVFARAGFKHPSLWRQVSDGSRPAEKLLDIPARQEVLGLSTTPDGRGVVYCLTKDAGVALFYFPYSGNREPELLDHSPRLAFPCTGRVSPDGRWLAYVITDGEQPNVFVRRLHGAGERIQVSADGGDSPLWSRDGRHLYYRHLEAGSGSNYHIGDVGAASLMVTTLRTNNRSIAVMDRRRLMALREAGAFDIAPDGRHVVMLERSDRQVEVVVTTNWLPQLRARLATDK